MKIRSFIRKFFVFCFCALFFNTLQAQLYTGGNAGIDYANGLYIDLAPLVGYRYKIFDTGVSPFVSYMKKNNIEESVVYGGRYYVQLHILRDLLVHAEIEGINNKMQYYLPDGALATKREWRLALPIGAGYSRRIAGNIGVHTLILYDLLLPKDSPIENPMIRAGVTYNF